MKIIINGREHDVRTVALDYGQILAMAGMPAGTTVTHCVRGKQGGGELARSGNLVAEPGLVINATYTGGA